MANALNFYDRETYLAHHGIKGQKWGIRRFQNPDGTRTEAGKKRYGSSESSGEKTKGFQLSDKQKQYLKTGAKIAGAALIAYGAYKIGSNPAVQAGIKAGVEAMKKYDDSDLAKARKQRALDVANRALLSDKELNERIERLQGENKYRDLAERDLHPGRAFVKDVLKDAGPKVAKHVVLGAGIYGAKWLADRKFNKDEFGKALFNAGPKKK